MLRQDAEFLVFRILRPVQLRDAVRCEVSFKVRQDLLFGGGFGRPHGIVVGIFKLIGQINSLLTAEKIAKFLLGRIETD